MALDPNQQTGSLTAVNPALVDPFFKLPKIEVPADGNPRKNAKGVVGTQYAFLDTKKTDAFEQQQKQQPPKENPYLKNDGGIDWGKWGTRLGRGTAILGAAAILFVPSNPGGMAYLADTPPGDAHEAGLIKQAAEAIDAGDDPGRVKSDLQRDLQKHREEKKKEKEKEASNQGGKGGDNNVQVRGNPCKIGPKGSNKCPDGEAHHIVPDFALRYGRPGNADLRVPNTPSYNQGPSICVKGNARTPGTEHNRIQSLTDGAISKLDDGTGSAKLGDVLREAKRTAGEAIPECKEQMDKAVDDAFKGADKDALVRTYNGPLREYNIPSLTPKGK